MNLSVTKKLGLTSRADMIDLLSSAGIVFGNETAWALGFEFLQEVTTSDLTNTAIESAKEKKAVQQEPGWTQFQPAPTEYWRVTGYESLQQETGQQKRSGKKQKPKKLPDLDEIRKGFKFSLEDILKRQPLAEMNYVTTQLRKVAGTGRSRNELDLSAAVDGLSRGQFLYRMPHRVRRVWGHELLCLEDRAHRLVPYWSDQDDVTTALSRLYPETGYTVARLGHGRTVLRIQSPESLYGHECPLPTPGTLVLALTDLGSLAIREEGPQVREYWADLGRLYMENGNRAVAMVPCLPEQVPAEVARYWHVIPWERSASAAVGDDRVGLERLLTVLSVAVRLEPELLRAVRKLLPETRDNPGIESLIWQDDFVASPNSVAADLSAAERKKRIAKFEREPIEIRTNVLELIREVRQIGYEDVWVSELLGLDAESQAEFSGDMQLAELQILSLASPGSRAPLENYAVWLERLDEQLTDVPHMKTEVREALAELVKKISDANIRPVSVWMPERIGLNPELPVYQVEIRQRGNFFLFEPNLASGATAGAVLSTGSLIAQLRTRSGEIRVHEVPSGQELTEAQFWAGGEKPTWVRRFGTDEYGPWCSFRVKDVEQILRWIPPGEFLMGSPDDEDGRHDDEGPRHRVAISRGFWMFDTPCTQALWFAVLETDQSEFKGMMQRPVENVSWDDSHSFIKSLNFLFPSFSVQLPTEAQWEYASRGPGNDKEKQKARYGDLDDVAWYSENSGGETHDVRLKQSNGYGLHDMLGNVWEWCQDNALRKYDNAAKTDPLFESAEARSSHVVRGGGWANRAEPVRAAFRDAPVPESPNSDLGFRCLSSPEPGAEPSREAVMRGNKSQRGGSPQDGERLFPPRGRNFSGDRQGVNPPSSLHSYEHPQTLHASRMLQLTGDSPAAAVSFPRSRVMQIETDCEILSLEMAPPPPWAVASGRDRYGLWAEFEFNGVRQRLRWIAPGSFLMGSQSKPESSVIDEQPQHSVTLKNGFWIFDTPCIQALWEATGLPNESRFRGNQRRPIENVEASQVQQFLEIINTRIGDLHLRLPTEAEWEYCGRAGVTAHQNISLDGFAWYDSNSGGETHEVKLKLPNEWGLYDMLGNVWEWCYDGQRNFEPKAEVNPVGTDMSNRIVRGGSWDSPEWRVRVAYRLANHPKSRYGYLGFRCVSTSAPSTAFVETPRVDETVPMQDPKGATTEKRAARKSATKKAAFDRSPRKKSKKKIQKNK